MVWCFHIENQENSAPFVACTVVVLEDKGNLGIQGKKTHSIPFQFNRSIK